MRQGMIARLDKLEGPQHVRGIVLPTLPGEEDGPGSGDAFLPMTAEAWEREFCAEQKGAEDE